MLRRVNFYGVCICGFCLLLLLAGSKFADNGYHQNRPSDHIEDSQYFEYNSNNLPESILDRTRLQIKNSWKDLNTSEMKGVSGLDDLILERGGNPIRSVIISSWRSGTTFLGEVLYSIPCTFYHYEPLLNYGIKQIRGPPQSDDVLKRLASMLKCDFSQMQDYFDFGKNNLHQFNHNTRLWEYCKHNSLCLDPEFTSNFCKLFPLQSMKVVRVRLKLMKKLLEDNSMRVKLVLLVRDPRAVMQSRQHRDWCPPAPDCASPALYCADLLADYVAAVRLLRDYPDRLSVLRFEDMASNVTETAHRLIRFLGLPYSSAVDDFLLSHTKTGEGILSTFRDTKQVPFRWRSLLNYTTVASIQDECAAAMNVWGYKSANSESDLTDPSFNPVGDYSLVDNEIL